MNWWDDRGGSQMSCATWDIFLTKLYSIASIVNFSDHEVFIGSCRCSSIKGCHKRQGWVFMNPFSSYRTFAKCKGASSNGFPRLHMCLLQFAFPLRCTRILDFAIFSFRTLVPCAVPTESPQQLRKHHFRLQSAIA